ncbi:uncharacterized protein DS421_20g696950 [Arachis hypogaea]|nr:uncharacterized protein DS421_20g696950 [Arachis hypogaea]
MSIQHKIPSEYTCMVLVENSDGKKAPEPMLIKRILADALPKIVSYVLINRHEELIPLIICAIENHPDSSTRDSLTHTLLNLIKRPDEQQKRIIMEACVSLAKNVGEMRIETELLPPQCWEQVHISCLDLYFLAGIEGPEQKFDSEAEKGLQMLLDSDLPALEVDCLELQKPNWCTLNCVRK